MTFSSKIISLFLIIPILFIFLPASAQISINGDFESYTDGSNVYDDGRVDGWYAFDSDSHRTVTVESNLNSPFGTGSQSVELNRTASGNNPTLLHSFNDFNHSTSGQVTGSWGGTMSGSGWSISFDWRQTSLNAQMQFAGIGTDRNNNIRAFRVEARFDGNLRINGDADNEISDVFSANEWYRVQLSNINFDNFTYDLDLIAWDDGDQNLV